MQIVINTPEHGSISWTLPENLNNRLEKVRSIWEKRGKKDVADAFEKHLQEDVSRFLLALSGSLTAALSLQAPNKAIDLIDQRMKSLLLEIGKLVIDS